MSRESFLYGKEWKNHQGMYELYLSSSAGKLRQGDCGIEASALIRKSDKELLHENFLRSMQTHDPSTVALCHYDCRGRILKQGRRSALYFPAVTYKCHAGAGKGTGNFDLCKKRTGRIPDAGRIGISSLCKRGVWAV